MPILDVVGETCRKKVISISCVVMSEEDYVHYGWNICSMREFFEDTSNIPQVFIIDRDDALYSALTAFSASLKRRCIWHTNRTSSRRMLRVLGMLWLVQRAPMKLGFMIFETTLCRIDIIVSLDTDRSVLEVQRDDAKGIRRMLGVYIVKELLVFKSEWRVSADIP